MCVNTRHQSLGCSFFITCRAIYLSSKEKTFNLLQFEGWLKLSRVKIIILYCICRPVYLCILQSLYIMKSLHLNIEWKRRRKSLEIIFICSPSLRLKKKLMFILSSKSPELIFNTRTVSRSYTCDQSGKQWRISETAP